MPKPEIREVWQQATPEERIGMEKYYLVQGPGLPFEKKEDNRETTLIREEEQENTKKEREKATK